MTIETAPAAGEINKRRELMADGRRYIIYYTFRDGGEVSADGDQLADDEQEVNDDVRA